MLRAVAWRRGVVVGNRDRGGAGHTQAGAGRCAEREHTRTVGTGESLGQGNPSA
jgi:hypothetical protein